MCNVFGGYSKYNKTPIEEIKLPPDCECLKMRGRDSYGIAGYSAQEGLYKEVTSDLKEVSFIPTSYYVGILCRAIPEPERIEHAKSGLDHSRDTQPFCNEEWIVSHNGTIVKPEETIKKWNLKVTSPVDSALLPPLFSQFGDPVEALKSIDGSFAVAAYNIKNHQLFLMANFQPLYYVESIRQVYYSSLPEQLRYLCLPVQKVLPYTALKFSDGVKTEYSLYREEVNNKVLVVASGGLDSVTAARLYQVLGYEVSLIHFLYSQSAESVEVTMMKKIAEKYKWPLMILDVSTIFKEAAKSSRLLNNKKPMQDALEDAESSMPSYVGNRNMIFGSIASGIAEENGIGRVVLGLNLSDGGGFADNCYPFLRNMSETLQTSLNQQKRVLFCSPFVHMMKGEILQVAIAIGSSLPYQVSCYYPSLQENGLPLYCSGCGSHLLRSYAFKNLGYKDPVPYKENFNWEECKELPEEFYKRMNKIDLKLKLEDLPFAEVMRMTL